MTRIWRNRVLKLQVREGDSWGGQRGLNEEYAGRRWRDGNRQGIDEEKRTEVTNLCASREELAIALTMERRDLHRARCGLSSHPVTN